MKVLFSDVLLGNYWCKQHYKLHISFCEVEKCVTLPPQMSTVFSCSMHNFTHQYGRMQTCLCIYQHVWQSMRLHLSQCQATHGRLVEIKIYIFMLQIGHWHGRAKLDSDRWSVYTVFGCTKLHKHCVCIKMSAHIYAHFYNAQMNYGRNSRSSAPPPLISPLPWHLAVANSLTWAWLQTINQDFNA